MKYSVAVLSKSKRRKRKTSSTRRKKYVRVSKVDRFKRMSGKKSSRTKARKKTVLGIDVTKLRKFFYILAGVGFFVGCIAVLVLGIYLKNLRDSLPAPDQLVARNSDQSTLIYDRNEKLLYTVYGDQNREFVPVDEIPSHTKWALLAAEDMEFYQHKGVDYAGIAMAVFQNFTSGELVRGASTLTQQLVKNTILFDVLGEEAYEKTYSRKIKEVLITMQVEQTLSKDEILQMYMNEVPLGGVNYGYQTAANIYFGKDVSELTLAESALLAGIITNSSIYSPLFGTNPELAESRQDFVLDQMLKNSHLTGVTEEEIEAAKEEELVFTSKKIDIKAPHFVFYVKSLLEEEYGAERVAKGGLRVITTLDYGIQEIAEEEISEGIAKGARYNVHNGSMVVLDPNNGDVLAMVGSVDYWNQEDPRVDGNVNIATSLRQVGSSAKPYTYLTAFTQGSGPWALAPDIKMSFGGYKPVNWDKKYMGLMTVREALGKSRNLPTVYTLQVAGITNFINTVEKLGITTLSDKADYGLSLALGSGEMKLIEHTAAFGVFANEGVKVETDPFLKVETSSGEVLYEKESPVTQRVFDEKEIYALNYILCDLGGHGDRAGASYRVQGRKVCFKTGTTNGPKDLLTMIYHKNLVVGIWAGNNNNEEMPGGWSSNVPLPIAHSFMQRVSDQYPVSLYSRPSGILSTSICTDTGRVVQKGVDCPSESNIFIQGHGPSGDKREIVYICESNGLVAENVEAAKKYELGKDYVVINNKLANTYQQSTYDKFLLGIEDGNYLISMPDSAECPLPLGPDNAPVIEIVTPTTGQEAAQGSNLIISGSVRVLDSVSEFTVSIDGNPIVGASINEDDTYSVTYEIPSDMVLGNHTVTVWVKDNLEKEASNPVVFNVVASASPITLVSPADGVNIVFPVALEASVVGTPSSVQFFINKVGGGYSTTLGAVESGGSWVATWGDSGGGNGDYTIQARAIISGTAYDSAISTVTY
ncbi:transglycosylase domain-containing protein [bacterium]|nr:transglycosylase domain-containing protein [bacterium]